MALVLLTACSAKAVAPARVVEPVAVEEVVHEKVRLEIFVMSQCPFSAKVQKAMVEVMEAIGEWVEYEQGFVGTKEGGGMGCLHGESECQGNIVELCAARHVPESHVALTACMASDFASIPQNWVACARQLDVDTTAMEGCVTGGGGAALLEEALAAAQERNVHASPTIFIDGKKYAGGREAAQLVAAICWAMDEPRPEGCPELVPVKLTVITDARCEECEARARKRVDGFAKMFGKIELEWLDWSEDAARELAEKAGVTLLPAFVFHPEAVDAVGWTMLEKYVVETGGYYVVKPHLSDATYDPSK